jgi:hypothetical protein
MTGMPNTLAATLALSLCLGACCPDSTHTSETLSETLAVPTRPEEPDYYEASRTTLAGDRLHELLAGQPITRISLWRGGCYGSCPIYRVDFFRDGRAVYEGEAYVELIGHFEIAHLEQTFALLAANAEAMRLLEMEDRYSASWTDDETVTVEIETDDGLKRIEDYGRFGPPLLRAFQRLVDGEVAAIDWD